MVRGYIDYEDYWGIEPEEVEHYKPMKNKMNNVSISDVTFLSLSIADFTAAATFLTQHDYPVAGGLAVLGIVLIYLYHKFGN